MTRNHYDANELVQQACAELGYNLCDLIALTTFWVHPQVLRLLSPVQGVWFPNRRRANLGLRVAGKPVEKVGDEIEGVVLDDNTYANTCFKRALGLAKSQIVGFEVCHIWPGTAYDPLYYTQLANLVAIPRELASLTDHSCDVIDCLKYRAWELYCWKPDEEPIPSKPAGYPLKWRAPLPCNRKISNAIFRRLNRNVLEQRTGHTGSAAAAMGHFDKALEEAAFMNVQRKGRRFWTANRDGRTYRFSVRFSGFSRSRQGWWYTFYDVDDDFAQVTHLVGLMGLPDQREMIRPEVFVITPDEIRLRFEHRQTWDAARSRHRFDVAIRNEKYTKWQDYVMPVGEIS